MPKLDDSLKMDRENWMVLRQFGAILERNLTSPSGTEMGDVTWKVVNSDDTEWSIYRTDMPPLDGDGPPIKISIENRSDEKGVDFWILGQNHVQGLSESHLIRKMDRLPKFWKDEIEAIGMETANWIKDQFNTLKDVGEQNAPELPNLPSTPSMSGNSGLGMGMAPGGVPPMASRKARLISHLLFANQE